MKRSMAKRMCWVVVVGVLLASAPVMAQDMVRGDDQTVFRKKTVIDFSDVTLEGELTKPQGQYGVSRSMTRFQSLIQLRQHFQGELNKSVEQL